MSNKQAKINHGLTEVQIQSYASRIVDVLDISDGSFSQFHYFVAKLVCAWSLEGCHPEPVEGCHPEPVEGRHPEEALRDLIDFDDIRTLALISEHLRDIEQIRNGHIAESI